MLALAHASGSFGHFRTLLEKHVARFVFRQTQRCVCQAPILPN